MQDDRKKILVGNLNFNLHFICHGIHPSCNGNIWWQEPFNRCWIFPFFRPGWEGLALGERWNFHVKFVQMWIFQTFWLEHQQHSWNHYLAILPCEAVISENQRSGGLVGQFWIMTSLLFEFSHMKTLKVIKHQHPNSNASGLRHFTKTFSNWFMNFMNMFSSLTGTMFLKFPFISETLAVVLLGEFRCFSFFLGGTVEFWCLKMSNLQKTVKKTPTSKFPPSKYLCLALF